MPLSIFLQKLPNIVLLLLVALLAYQLALFTWSLLPVEKSAGQWAMPEITGLNSANNIDSDKLKGLQLFGKTVAPAAKPKKRLLPETMSATKLNLTLAGVVAASDPLYSSAIIANNGRQDSYFINSKIEGTSAFVYEIYEDHIVLDENGTYQILMLDGFDTANNRSSKETPTQAPMKEIALDRSEILKDPSKLTNYINISPVREGSEIKGYRLTPGRDPALFEQAGLENGDLVVELNGVDLTNMAESMSLMQEFPTMTEISLTVDREGQLYELYFSIP
ncbi:general secretion pathway protein C [Psychromonas ingrahamii 37]|uniref:General secretion pathway protein C n=1 Tax=Psychromonas ingrahamii (strain DSM 17664 / CCUG 51855 / 37) TaxID=357804 RepID=A1SR55_PSYIN|nr:type II secretion system protein GspC [Psychromonas ingrahamii]ABM01970.1 general secretion pathway protein C [Psychromonas ingrahamii 37]